MNERGLRTSGNFRHLGHGTEDPAAVPFELKSECEAAATIIWLGRIAVPHVPLTFSHSEPESRCRRAWNIGCAHN